MPSGARQEEEEDEGGGGGGGGGSSNSSRRGLRQWMAEKKKKKEEELEERRRKRKMKEWDNKFLNKYCTTLGITKKQICPSVRIERLPKLEDFMENAKLKRRRAMRKLGIERRKNEIEAIQAVLPTANRDKVRESARRLHDQAKKTKLLDFKGRVQRREIHIADLRKGYEEVDQCIKKMREEEEERIRQQQQQQAKDKEGGADHDDAE